MGLAVTGDFYFFAKKRGGSLVICFVMVLLWVSSSHGKVGASCECPKLECNSCQEQTGLTFYSEKCGDGSRVRSCARPSCEWRASLTAGCKTAKRQTPKAERIKIRQPAGQQQVRGPEIGKATLVKGTAWLEELSGKRDQVFVGDSVSLKDLLITGKSAEVKVEFQDGNEIHIQPGSRVKIKEYDLKTKRRRGRRVLLYLIKGQVRNKVKNKYNNKVSSSYRVKTRSAVVGVRGTDFVVTFKVGHKERTKVETLSGEVKLANLNFSQSVNLPKGTMASYVVEPNSSDVFSDKEISEFVDRGYMTPVHKMTTTEIEHLDWETEVTNRKRQLSRTKSKKTKPVCQSPQAELNQCYWTCRNNPKGEKRCRTDLPQVSCLRRRCNANGIWADKARRPASFHDQCPPVGTRVGPCDY